MWISPHQQRLEMPLQVNLPAGSISLAGELNLPAVVSGLVLFAYGSGSNRFSPRNQFVAEVIREAGFGTLLFDLLTPEEEAIDLQTRHLRFNIPLLAERLIAATDWVKSRPETCFLHTGYFGSSTGGAAALIAAAEFGGDIRAVVSRGGRPDLAGEALSKVTAPTLLIVGELDEVVLRLNEEALTRLQCVKELKIVPNATHLFEEPGKLEEAAYLAADWFQRHLC